MNQNNFEIFSAAIKRCGALLIGWKPDHLSSSIHQQAYFAEISGKAEASPPASRLIPIPSFLKVRHEYQSPSDHLLWSCLQWWYLKSSFPKAIPFIKAHNPDPDCT